MQNIVHTVKYKTREGVRDLGTKKRGRKKKNLMYRKLRGELQNSYDWYGTGTPI